MFKTNPDVVRRHSRTARSYREAMGHDLHIERSERMLLTETILWSVIAAVVLIIVLEVI